MRLKEKPEDDVSCTTARMNLHMFSVLSCAVL